MRKTVALLFGGRSAEHEISVQSAETVAAALAPRWRVLPVYVERSGRWRLQAGPRPRMGGGRPVLLGHRPVLLPEDGKGARVRLDAAFPVLHGPYGEDGTVQGLLELAGLPYVGSGVYGSSLGMEKEASKRAAVLAGLRAPRHAAYRQGDALTLQPARRLGLPLFVKPARLGSSVGVRKVTRWSQLVPALRHALRYDTTALAEEAVEGLEVAVAVLGDERRAAASEPGAMRPSPKHPFYTYEAKYVDPHGSETVVPAPLPAAKRRELQAAALTAFRALELYGMARVDFLLDRRGRVYFGEANSIPGFTSHSLYPRLFAAAGLPLPKVLDRLLQLAFERHRRKARLRLTPDL